MWFFYFTVQIMNKILNLISILRQVFNETKDYFYPFLPFLFDLEKSLSLFYSSPWIEFNEKVCISEHSIVYNSQLINIWEEWAGGAPAQQVHSWI